jgi:hypothetical protein
MGGQSGRAAEPGGGSDRACSGAEARLPWAATQIASRIVSPRRVLLFLDTFELLQPAATDTAELLSGCLSVSVFLTSCKQMRIRRERVVVVPP